MSAARVDLRQPPALGDGTLRIVPLGGVGEIGRNMTVFEYGGRLLIVDCGVLFPESHQPGVDLILPDFSYIRDRYDDVEAVILTHGHEDHIGAVPFLLREAPNLQLYGSKLTMGLVNGKLTEHRLSASKTVVAEGEVRSFGPFECEFLSVTHSIPDALAVSIRTPAGTVLHTGDFKMDQLPLDGRLTDLGGFFRLGNEGVDLLMADSTNADVPGFVRPETDIAPVLEELFAKARGRIIVACFSSHIHRVQQILDVADRSGRNVAFVGRSMVRNMGIARDLGFLKVPTNLVVNLDDVDMLPDNRVVLVSTGSQGEPLSALARMASRDHQQIRIVPEDTVVLASSLIPGNENAVFRVINGLSKIGATVVAKEQALVHVSGHSSAGELRYVLNAVRPSSFMPVHGEWRHLAAHGQIAIATGVAEENVVLAEDGTVIDLSDGVARIVGKVPCGFVYVDGLVVGDISEAALKDRRILGDEGFVMVVAAVDLAAGKLASDPVVFSRGVSDEDLTFSEIDPLIVDALEIAMVEGVDDPGQLQQIVRRTVGKWVSDTFRRRPMIIPVVVEV